MTGAAADNLSLATGSDPLISIPPSIQICLANKDNHNDEAKKAARHESSNATFAGIGSNMASGLNWRDYHADL